MVRPFDEMDPCSSCSSLAVCEDVYELMMFLIDRMDDRDGWWPCKLS